MPRRRASRLTGTSPATIALALLAFLAIFFLLPLLAANAIAVGYVLAGALLLVALWPYRRRQ